MEFDLIVKNGMVVMEDQVRRCDIGVGEGKILALAKPGVLRAAQTVVDAEGRHVFPGGIDTHSHFFEPGPTYREDVHHGTRAAAMGGYTTVMDMPNTDPPVRDEETFLLKQRLLSDNAHVDFMLWGASLPGEQGAIPRLKELGCPAFKAFTLDAGPSFPWSDSLALYEGMEQTREAGGVFAVHAEDPDIVARLRERYENGPFSLAMHDRARPWYAELAAIQKAIALAEAARCPLHICHTSIPEGVRAAVSARERGVDVTVETCPHYLLCDYESVAGAGAYALICPPIRNRERADALWRYVADGSIAYMGTDHAPYTKEDKEPARPWDAPGGSPNIDVAIPMVLEEAVHHRGIGLTGMAAFLATNAAKRFGVYPTKGAIRIGSDADLFVVDMDAPWTYSRANSFSKTKETAFMYEGRSIRCRVEATIVRGAVVYRDGRICGPAGYGNLVRPLS